MYVALRGVFNGGAARVAWRGMTASLRAVAGGDPFDLPWPRIAEDEVLCAGLSIADGSAWLPWACRRASEGEKAHAGRFLRPVDALRHLAGRAACRSLLAALRGGRAVDGEFTANRWGKPSLVDGDLEFSISHSGDEIWLAAARAMPVGIDVQQDEPGLDAQGLGDAFFHPLEAQAIRDAGPEGGPAAFRRCWVRKEAVVKALGRGLSVPLSSFAVAVDARGGDWLARPPRSDEGPVWDGAWATLDLPAPAGYSAALAALGSPGRVAVCRIEPPLG